jgi:hypothetical protein
LMQKRWQTRPEKVRRLGPYSKPAVLAKLDQRTREARILHDTREALTEHIGGNPSATERALIDRAAWLTLRVAQLDAKMAAGNTFTDHDHRHYLAWSNSLRLILRDLGLKGTVPGPSARPGRAKPGPRQITLEEHLEMLRGDG